MRKNGVPELAKAIGVRFHRPWSRPPLTQRSWKGRVAVAEFDGGRVQLRDETWGEKKTRMLGEKRP